MYIFIWNQNLCYVIEYIDINIFFIVKKMTLLKKEIFKKKEILLTNCINKM